MGIPPWVLALAVGWSGVLMGMGIRLYRTWHSWMRKYRDDKTQRCPELIKKYRRLRPPHWDGAGADCVEPEKGSYGARGPVGLRRLGG